MAGFWSPVGEATTDLRPSTGRDEELYASDKG